MNHPHKAQAAAMARAGELPDGEQLRECINSGQVSAAQVVAHAEDGELSMSMFAGREDYDKAVARDGIPLVERLKQEAQMHAQEARTANATIAEIYQLCTGATGEPGNWHGADPVRAALAAERAEVARLREALSDALNFMENMDPDESFNPPTAHWAKALTTDLRAALTAPGEKHD